MLVPQPLQKIKKNKNVQRLPVFRVYRQTDFKRIHWRASYFSVRIIFCSRTLHLSSDKLPFSISLTFFRNPYFVGFDGLRSPPTQRHHCDRRSRRVCPVETRKLHAVQSQRPTAFEIHAHVRPLKITVNRTLCGVNNANPIIVAAPTASARRITQWTIMDNARIELILKCLCQD